jgi:hypothetical protein
MNILAIKVPGEISNSNVARLRRLTNDITSSLGLNRAGSKYTYLTADTFKSLLEEKKVLEKENPRTKISFCLTSQVKKAKQRYKGSDVMKRDHLKAIIKFVLRQNG